MLSSENMETRSVVLPTNITGNVSTTAPPTNGTGELDVISLFSDVDVVIKQIILMRICIMIMIKRSHKIRP